jgi:bacterioferritin-associated ferredoxin
MVESREAVRERVRKFRELKKRLGVHVTNGNAVTVKEEIVTKSLQNVCNGCSVVMDLIRRVELIEGQMNPDTRKQALKAGGHPAELYGA